MIPSGMGHKKALCGLEAFQYELSFLDVVLMGRLSC